MNGEINKSLKKINATVEMKNLNIKSHPNLKEENAHSNAQYFDLLRSLEIRVM